MSHHLRRGSWGGRGHRARGRGEHTDTIETYGIQCLIIKFSIQLIRTVHMNSW